MGTVDIALWSIAGFAIFLLGIFTAYFAVKAYKLMKCRDSLMNRLDELSKRYLRLQDNLGTVIEKARNYLISDSVRLRRLELMQASLYQGYFNLLAALEIFKTIIEDQPGIKEQWSYLDGIKARLDEVADIFNELETDFREYQSLYPNSPFDN